MSDLVALKQQVADCGARIARLLGADLKHFALRTVRARYVAGGAAAEVLSPEAVGALKEATEEMGEHLSIDLETALVDAWDGVLPEGAEIDTLPAVAAALAQALADFEGFAAARGFAGEAQYSLPKRFIDGENLVSLGRTLRKLQLRREVLLQEARARSEEARAAQRARLWDEA